MGVYFIFGNNRKIYKNTTVFDLYTHTFGNFYGTIFTVCLGNFGIHRRLITEGIGIKRMNRRMRRKLLAFMMLVCLAIGTIVPQAGAEGTIEVPENQAPMQVDDQQLPLPDAAPSVASVASGIIKLGEIPGYRVSHGQAMLSELDASSLREISHTPIPIEFGSLNFQNIVDTIDPESNYTLRLKSNYFADNSTDDVVAYLDEIDLTGRQLLEMTEWPIDPATVMVSPDLSVPQDLTEKYMKFSIVGWNFYPIQIGDYPDLPHRFRFLMKPGKLDYIFVGKKDQAGYTIKKTIEIENDTAVFISEDDIASTVEIGLPDNSGVHNQADGIPLGFVNKLFLSKSEHRIGLFTEENGSTYQWLASLLVSAPKQLTLEGDLTAEFETLSMSGRDLIGSLSLRKGDFDLGSARKVDDYSGEHRTTSSFLVKTDGGELVREIQPSSWDYIETEFDPSLPSGKYTVEAAVTVPGYTSPISVVKPIIINQIARPDSSGLTIQAEDDIGQPLRDAQIFLYEKQWPDIYEANDGVTNYYTSQKYRSYAIETGKLVIPDRYLVPGTEYELVVTGTSSTGQAGGVYYHQAVTSADTSLNLTQDRLKKLTYSASIAQEGDVLNLAVKKPNSFNLVWPITIPFDAQKKAVVYVGTNDHVFSYGYIYPAGSGVGYYLQDERSVEPMANQTVDLAANLVHVTPPAGYSDASLKINSGFSRASWYVAKGIEAWAEFSVVKNGYQYSFIQHVLTEGDKQLTFSKRFDSASDKYFVKAGGVNLEIHKDFYDSYATRLHKVSTIEQLESTEASGRGSSAFTVWGSEGATELQVENTGEFIEYRPVVDPFPGGGGSASAPTLEYQLYDDHNQPTGSRWYTDLENKHVWNAPLIPGNYTLKLENQLFPDEVVTLSSEIEVQVWDEALMDQFRIPVRIPAGYTFIPYDIHVDIRSSTREDFGIGIGQNGDLTIYGKSRISADKDFVILLSVPLTKPGVDGVTYYYNQVRVTGEQLLQLKEISVPDGLIEVRPKLTGIPKDVTSLKSQYVMPVEGYERNFKIFASDVTKIGTTWYGNRILTLPGRFSLNLAGVGGTMGYSIVQNIDAKGTDIRVEDVPRYKIRFGQELPFLSFYNYSEEQDDSLTGGYSINRQALLDRLFVTEGSRWLAITTIRAPSPTTPWTYEWVTRNQVNINQDLNLDFDGEVNLQNSYLSIEQTQENEETILWIMPELVSGQMKLESVWSSWNGDSVFPLSGKVLIKNSAGNIVYAGQTINWDAEIFVKKKLAAGNYELTFVLPTGPNEEISLTKSFTVSSIDDTVAPTVPTGLRETGTDATSVTLAWNPSTDAFGVAGYRIYVGSSQVGTTSGATAYKVTGLIANTPYSFTVRAYDAKGNLSAASQSLTVRTACAGICGGGGGGGGFMFGNSEDENTVMLTNRDIPAASGGKISIDVQDKTTIVLPARITELVGKNDLAVRFGNAVVLLPPQVLAQLSQFIKTSGLSDASIRLTAVQLEPVEVQNGLASDPSTGVTVFSPIFELKLAVVGRTGEEKMLSAFDAPITVHFPVNSGADRRLTGIYYIADNGKLEYIGGKWEGNELVAELSHFSKYGVLEIKKNFEDVAAKHWALSVIQELAAKQIVNGVTDTKFAPEKKVTRSEFAAMLVKALRLKPGAGSTVFEDVPRNAWYSEAVAAAYAHRLIKGLSDSRFAPQEQITREQMAIMVMNAYKMSLKTDSPEAVLEFKDSGEISKWAQASVAEASSLGLLRGRNGKLFAPKDNASRAEAVQVISNLLQQLLQ